MLKQILLMLVVITSSLHAGATSNPIPTEKLLDDIVTAQRAMILLLDKSPSNDPLSDYIFAARNAYVVKQDGIEQLITLAETEQPSPGLTLASETLIRYTQTTLQSHPADLLAFNDLYDELIALEKARALPAQELAKLERATADYQKAFNHCGID